MGTWLSYFALGRHASDGKRGSGREEPEPLCFFVSVVTGLWNTAALFIYLSKNHKRVTTRTCSIGKPGRGYSCLHASLGWSSHMTLVEHSTFAKCAVCGAVVLVTTFFFAVIFYSWRLSNILYLERNKHPPTIEHS